MKAFYTCLPVVLLSAVGGCMWPGATWIHGSADVRTLPEQEDTGGRETSPPERMIMVQYWRVQRVFGNGYEHRFLRAEVMDRAEVSVSFPVGLYPVFFTPALGVQHVVPEAGIIVFADGYWPVHVIARDGRMCCEAPTTGERHWHIVLVPTSVAPPEVMHRRFPPLTHDKLGRLLARNRNINKGDQGMCRRQLQRLLEHLDRDAPEKP